MTHLMDYVTMMVMDMLMVMPMLMLILFSEDLERSKVIVVWRVRVFGGVLGWL